ncbi:MAG: hypothetical protein ACRC33_11020 [Gemmataceae bacterium]
MSEPVETFPAPSLELPVPLTKYERERRAFEELLPELLKTHRGLWVAIHEERVEDADANELVLAERVLKRVGNVSIHIGLVAESVPVERLPHCRIPQRKQP